METLTLEQAYYIAQMVAAVILVLSVVYLALQVHQNTHAMRLSNFRSLFITFFSGQFWIPCKLIKLCTKPCWNKRVVLCHYIPQAMAPAFR